MIKENNIKKELSKSIKYIIPIVLVIVGILTIRHYSDITKSIASNIKTIKGILAPLFIGFIIAYILNHPMSFLERKFKLKRGISVAIIYISLVLILVGGWLYIVPDIESNISELVAYIPNSISQIEEVINTLSSKIISKINNPDIKGQISEFTKNVLIPFSTTTAKTIGSFLINSMSTVVSYTVNIVLGIVISVYLLLSKEQAIESITIISRRLLGRHYDKVNEFVSILDKNIGVYIVAKSMDSTIYATICVIALSLAGSEYALIIGIIAGITNMIPFFGPIIGTVVAVVINLFFSFNKAMVVLVVMIIVQQLETAVLEPYFIGKQVGVPPVITILAVTFATAYTGFIGILLSVPIASVILIYVNRFIEKEKAKYISQ